MNEQKQPTGRKLITDIIPLVVFVIAYNLSRRFFPGEAIYISTGAFMLVTLLVIGWLWFRGQHISPMLILSAVLVGGFGGMTLLLRDPLFIMVKPTIINLLYAGLIFGSLLLRRNALRALLSSSFHLPERIWNILAVRWGLWFLFLAGLNEIIWRSFPEEFWANFKLLGMMPLTVIFALANAPLMLRHIDKDQAADN